MILYVFLKPNVPKSVGKPWILSMPCNKLQKGGSRYLICTEITELDLRCLLGTYQYLHFNCIISLHKTGDWSRKCDLTFYFLLYIQHFLRNLFQYMIDSTALSLHNTEISTSKFSFNFQSWVICSMFIWEEA